MTITRRELLGAMAGGATAQTLPRSVPVRTRPPVCLASGRLQRLDYSELGPALRGLGLDGCDLLVRRGGHVEPERALADLLRAIEGIRGEGVDVPMITTAFLSAAEPWARTVVGIAGTLGVPYFTAGPWPYTGAENIEARLADVRREIAGLASLGRAYEIAFGVHNRVGEFAGASVWDTHMAIAGLDPRWTGYYFDPCHATAHGALAVTMKLALPRIKMVAVRDFYWKREAGGRWRFEYCPLGEGMVDWAPVFAQLARARFTGPLSLHVEYEVKDEIAAVRRDLEFVRQQVAAAYSS